MVGARASASRCCVRLCSASTGFHEFKIARSALEKIGTYAPWAVVFDITAFEERWHDDRAACERDAEAQRKPPTGSLSSPKPVFAEPSDLILLGVRTIEGFGVVVDNVGHRFVAQASIVALIAGSAKVDDER